MENSIEEFLGELNKEKISNFYLSIKTIHLNNKELITIPKEIQKFKNIMDMRIAFCKIKEIPKEIIELKKLKILDLSRNQIEQIPSEVYSLISLEYLALNHNKIIKISREIGNLINLKRLILDNNEIKIIPKEIKNLGKLQILYLGHNKIKMIPEEIGLLHTLGQFTVNDNEISEVPVEVLALPRILHLNFRYNDIGTLPYCSTFPGYSLKTNEGLIIEKTIKKYESMFEIHTFQGEYHLFANRSKDNEIPTLLEISGKIVLQTKKLKYQLRIIPEELIEILNKNKYKACLKCKKPFIKEIDKRIVTLKRFFIERGYCSFECKKMHYLLH